MQSSIQPLVSQLHARLRASEFGERIVVHEGPALEASTSEKAGSLRESGASWDWVALGVDIVDFWDTHIGMIPDSSLSGYYTVGLHWTERYDTIIRPAAAAIIGPGEPNFSQIAEEFQLPLSTSEDSGSLPGPEAAAAAIALAIQLLSFSSTHNTHHQEGH